MMNLENALDKLKIKELKPKQKRIITKLVNKKQNIIGILPTGYGKSLCYIVPHLLLGKNTIVISPLISLIEDQINKLDKYNIPYVCFTSLHKHTQPNLKKILDGTINGILYFSPESFLIRQLVIKSLISKNSVGLICLDESHCLTTWKHFRQSYSDISVFQKWIKGHNIPILCLTATATNESIKNIMKDIKMNKATIVKGSFYKETHQIKCYMKSSVDNDIDKMIQLINNNKGKSLIYCKTRAETEKLSRKLNHKGIKSSYYHAQIRGNERLKIQNNYVKGDLDIMTATIAFGMGIDIPNIYLVIHYGISHDMESYYQEIGRGGRDNNQTICVVFWNNRDFAISMNFDDKINDLTARAESKQKIWKMREYVNTLGCRQEYICDYFGETIESCGRCDNCRRNKMNNNIPIFTNYLILINIYKKNPITYTQLINYLYTKTSLKEFFKSGIKKKVDSLIENKYIKTVKNGKILELSLTIKGNEWLIKRNKIPNSIIIITNFIRNNMNVDEISRILSTFRKI